MAEWVDDLATEHVHVAVEDIKNLADWGHIKEEIDGSFQNFLERGLGDLMAHRALLVLHPEVLHVSDDDTHGKDDRDLLHEGAVLLSLFLRICRCKNLLLFLLIDRPELEGNCQHNDVEEHLPSTDDMKDLLVGATVSVDILISLIDKQLADRLFHIFVHLVVETGKLLQLVV